MKRRLRPSTVSLAVVVASAKTAAGLAEVVMLLAGMTAENWAEHRDKALAIMRG